MYIKPQQFIFNVYIVFLQCRGQYLKYYLVKEYAYNSVVLFNWEHMVMMSLTAHSVEAV